MVIFVFFLLKCGNWYYILDIFMEILYFRYIYEVDIILILYNGYIYGEGDGGVVWGIFVYVFSV